MSLNLAFEHSLKSRVRSCSVLTVSCLHYNRMHSGFQCSFFFLVSDDSSRRRGRFVEFGFDSAVVAALAPSSVAAASVLDF
nr:hypothetical protein [Tanacetum cinerariifolium]